MSFAVFYINVYHVFLDTISLEDVMAECERHGGELIENDKLIRDRPKYVIFSLKIEWSSRKNLSDSHNNLGAVINFQRL